MAARAHPVFRRALPVAAALAVASAPARADCPAGRSPGQHGDHVRVGFTPGPPLVVRGQTDAEASGLALDILRGLARREGWKLDLVEVGAETLPARVAACELDLGVAAWPINGTLATTVDFSLPYLSTVTTALVRAGDAERAAAGVERRSLRLFLRAAATGAVGALLALAVLAIASWLLNISTGLLGRGVRWRRTDPTIAGPWAGVRWLWRSTTGRVLGALWCAIGLFFGATVWTRGAVRSFAGSEDPLRRLVEEAAHSVTIVGERVPDGYHVPCVAGATQACFRGFADGTIAALAGPREILCAGVEYVQVSGVALREDISVQEHFAYLLPRGSAFRLPLDAALLAWREAQGLAEPAARCPGGAW